MSHVILQFNGRQLHAERGARLLDVLDELPGHGLPLACRAGNCGTCRVRVLEGEAELQQPAAAELAQLARAGAGPAERLGCQVWLRAHAAPAEHSTPAARDPGARIRIERVL